jgi:NAD(P)-dependent dehydrogenase (short-subunit alcohol dehydrogenase family)
MTADYFALDGKVALVTGGNSGIGRALAFALRDAGGMVVIGGRRQDRNLAILAELGPDHDALELDVVTKHRLNVLSRPRLIASVGSTF